MHANINVTGFLFSLALPALSIIYRTRSERVLGGQVFNRRPVLSVMSLFIDHILDVFLFFLLACCRYLTLREQKLMKRRKEAENLLEDKKKLLEWEKRLDKEESLVRNLLNEALSLESSRNKARTTSITSEEEEHKGKR